MPDEPEVIPDVEPDEPDAPLPLPERLDEPEVCEAPECMPPEPDEPVVDVLPVP